MNIYVHLIWPLLLVAPISSVAGAMAVDPSQFIYYAATADDPIDDIHQSLRHAEANIKKSNPLRGEITRAVFSHGIDGYEPVDELISISVQNHKVYFFTDQKNMKGETIIHRWEYKNTIKATVEFPITADRYRVHSSKVLLPNDTGEWQVVVTNQDGQVLARNKITVVP